MRAASANGSINPTTPPSPLDNLRQLTTMNRLTLRLNRLLLPVASPYFGHDALIALDSDQVSLIWSACDIQIEDRHRRERSYAVRNYYSYKSNFKSVSPLTLAKQHTAIPSRSSRKTHFQSFESRNPKSYEKNPRSGNAVV